MRTNLEKALTEKPNRGPRNRTEQRAVWRRKLQEDLELERETAEWLESNAGLKMELLCSAHVPRNREESLKRCLECRATTIDLLFTIMHRIAYFDGILGGTGISKDASQPSLHSEGP